MFAASRTTSFSAPWLFISHRSYMVIRSKSAKRLQNITSLKRKRKKQERLKWRYKEYYEDIRVPTAFNARNPLHIPCRYLLTDQRDPLPKYMIKKIEICTNVRITALYKQAPDILLKLPQIMEQLTQHSDGIQSSDSQILQQMITRSFLFSNALKTSTNNKNQSDINMFIGSILFEGKRDDIKHALQLYIYMESMREECALKIPGIPNHILNGLSLDHRKVFFSRKRSLSKFNDLLYDVKHPNIRRIKRFIDPSVTEKNKYIEAMNKRKETQSETQLMLRTNNRSNHDLIPFMPSILSENRLQKLSQFVESYLLSKSFTRQSDGTTDLVLYGSKSCKQLVQKQLNQLSKSCFTLLVGDKKLPLVLWQFPWIYWKVFTLTQSRAWEDFNKPGILWLHSQEKWRTVKACQFLQTFLDNIDVIDINPKYYAAIVGYKGKMIANLQNECGATVFTYKHSKVRIAKNEAKEKETKEMMMRWAQKKVKKYQELEQRDKDPMSTAGMWKKWQVKKAKDPIKERQRIDAQIEKLSNTRKWIAPNIEFNEEWKNKLMVLGDKEAKNAVRKYVEDIVCKTHVLPLADLEFRAIFQSTNYDKQKKEYEIKCEKKQKKLAHKDYKQQRLQIRMNKLNMEQTEETQTDLEAEPFRYRYEKIDHEALIKKLERELQCILTFDDRAIYISNAADVDAICCKLKYLCQKHKWRSFDGYHDLDEMNETQTQHLQTLNRALIKNKQIRWYLMDPSNNAEFKQVLWKYRGLQHIWNEKRCELTFYGLQEMIHELNKDIQIYLKQFKVIEIENLDADNWMAIHHRVIKENVNTIYQETGVRVFNLKKGKPILIAKDIQNLEIAKQLLLDLYKSVACIYIKPKQLGSTRNIIDKLQNKYECDIIINPKRNKKKQHAVHVIYHNSQLRDQLIKELNKYLAQHASVAFKCKQYVTKLHSKHFVFPKRMKNAVLYPLGKFYGVKIDAKYMSDIKMIGYKKDVQYIKKTLTRFCTNVHRMHIGHQSKGPLIYRFLMQYEAQYPSIYYWWDKHTQSMWSSILPIAIRQQREVIKSQTKDNVIHMHIGEVMNTDSLMTDTSRVQLQFDLFCKYFDHAHQHLVSLYLGRHLDVLLQQNLPFELDTVEYIKEEKELDQLMMMQDDEYDKTMKAKQDNKADNKPTESRLQMIKKMSCVDFTIDEQNHTIHFLGTQNQMNIAYDLIQNILQNIEYIEINDNDAQILLHQHFSTTHGDIEMSHKSVLAYISDECQVKLDVIQAYKEEIDALNVNEWDTNMHKQQAHMTRNLSVVSDPAAASTQLLLLKNPQNTYLANRSIPNLYLVVYGNEMRRTMVKDKLEQFVSSMDVDISSSINAPKPLEKLNRDQRRVIYELFKIKRAQT